MEKYDKSLTEVWEWRRKLHEDLKNLTPKEYVEKIREDTDRIIKEKGLKLKIVKSKRTLSNIES
jgi:hypothetical protein